MDEYVSYVSGENNSPQLSSDDLSTTNNHNNAHPANMHENNINNTVVSSIVHTHAERQHKQCKEKQLRKDFRMHMAVGDKQTPIWHQEGQHAVIYPLEHRQLRRRDTIPVPIDRAVQRQRAEAVRGRSQRAAGSA